MFGWTTFGGALAPVVLVVVGLLLAGSSKTLSDAVAADPIGALTSILPVWFLVPFALVAILGLVGGAVLDIYSSGLALLTAGIRIPRPVAAGVDGVVMIAGAIYVAFVAPDFSSPFQAFLVTLGTPIAAWCGVFIADLLLRRRDYASADLYDSRGRYGSVRWSGGPARAGRHRDRLGSHHQLVRRSGLAQLAGLPARPARRRRPAPWAYANLGVLVALLIGFLGTLLLSRGAVRRQEALPLDEPR